MMQQDRQLEALRSALNDINRTINGLPQDALTWKGSEGWSLNHVIVHLKWLDRVFWDRFMRMVAEDEPAFAYLTDDEMRTDDPDQPGVFERWQATRGDFIAWLEARAPGDLNRAGLHWERGRVTMRAEVQYLINHDTEHVNQIADLRAAWEQTQKGDRT